MVLYGTVFIMVIPYCMIHFPNRFRVTGAIIAGVVLGSLALRVGPFGGVSALWRRPDDGSLVPVSCGQTESYYRSLASRGDNATFRVRKTAPMSDNFGG